MSIVTSRFTDGEHVRIHEHPPSEVFHDGTLRMDGLHARIELDDDGTAIDPRTYRMHHLPIGPHESCSQCAPRDARQTAAGSME